MEASTAERRAGIQLPYVKRAGGPPLRDALSRRASNRMFDASPLEAQTLADLLWCGFGINRPDGGGRTVPSARGWCEIDIYVALSDGAYRYDPPLNRLEFVAADDIRAAIGVKTSWPKRRSTSSMSATIRRWKAQARRSATSSRLPTRHLSRRISISFAQERVWRVWCVG